MAEIDDELVARAIRWCAEAGRHAAPEDVRRALVPLSWDQLLAARALLADPPAARPLGPHALADMARGAPADVAAERERGGRYAPERDGPPAPAETPPGAPSPHRAGTRRTAPARRQRAPVIRRARDRAAPEPSPAPRLPSIDRLHAPEGRAVLEALVRRHGARAALLARELAAGWLRPDGAPPGEEELRALLDTHGMARAFARREREGALHALRAAGGVKRRAAAELGLDLPGLDRLLARHGAAGEAEDIREERRRELRRRATLSERARLILAESERLEDLGLLEEFEADLRARLPDHLRALRAADRGPVLPALSRSLALSRESVEVLVRRLGLALAPPPPAAAGPRTGPRPGTVPRRGARSPSPRGPRRPRPSGRRPPE